MSDREISDGDWFEQIKSKREAREARELATAIEDAAKRGKEVFDLSAFEDIYDTSSDLGGKAPRDDRVKVWTWKYYVNYPDLMTMQDLADLMKEMDPYL